MGIIPKLPNGRSIQISELLGFTQNGEISPMRSCWDVLGYTSFQKEKPHQLDGEAKEPL